jgi:hypothetical protein
MGFNKLLLGVTCIQFEDHWSAQPNYLPPQLGSGFLSSSIDLKNPLHLSLDGVSFLPSSNCGHQWQRAQGLLLGKAQSLIRHQRSVSVTGVMVHLPNTQSHCHSNSTLGGVAQAVEHLPCK